MARGLVGDDHRYYEVHPREPGDAPHQRARERRPLDPSPRQPATEPPLRRAGLHAGRLDRPGPRGAGRLQRRPERNRGGRHARLGADALLPAARSRKHRRLAGEDRPLRRTLPGRADHRGRRHPELAADLFRAPGRNRREPKRRQGKPHRRRLSRPRNARARWRRLGALPRPLRRPARWQPRRDPRGLPGERGVLRHRRPGRRRGPAAAAGQRHLLRVHPPRSAGQRRAGLPLDRRRGAGGELRARGHHLRRALALPRGRHGDRGGARSAPRPRHRAHELHAVRLPAST